MEPGINNYQLNMIIHQPYLDDFSRILNSPIKTRNCRTDVCAVKYGRLRSELEEAQQVCARILLLINSLNN